MATKKTEKATETTKATTPAPAPAPEPKAEGNGRVPRGTPTPETEALAQKLEGLAKEAEALGEAEVAKAITKAAASARWFGSISAARRRRFGGLVAHYQEQGLSAEEILAKLAK
jgi:hypothetical protein